jgi:hypothetical protein
MIFIPESGLSHKILQASVKQSRLLVEFEDIMMIIQQRQYSRVKEMMTGGF